MKISDNMPTLSWSTVACDKYEVWLDGRLAYTVSHGKNFYIPFPLSFGRHTWYVTAVKKDRFIQSDVYEFTLKGRPLGNIPKGSTLLRNRLCVSR